MRLYKAHSTNALATATNATARLMPPSQMRVPTQAANAVIFFGANMNQSEYVSPDEAALICGVTSKQYFLRSQNYAKHPDFLANVRQYGKRKIQYRRSDVITWYERTHQKDNKSFKQSIEQIRKATNVGVIVG